MELIGIFILVLPFVVGYIIGKQEEKYKKIKRMARNYKQEYARYQGTPEQKKRRAMRNKVRRQALKDGRVTKGSGFDIHHRDGNPMNTSPNNLIVQHSSQNRSFKRDKNAKKV